MHNRIYFGTDGIRGAANKYPFDTQTLIRLGHAIGLWAINKYATKQPALLIASDTRESCDNITYALYVGIQKTTCLLHDAGTLPTPAIMQLIKHDLMYQAGIVISASHNPYHDNGIKLFDAHTGKLSTHDETAIIAQFEQLTNTIPSITMSASQNYTNAIVQQFPPNFLCNKKIVLDCAHGATYQVAPKIFSTLGAQVITLSHNPNGTNINQNCGALHPELVKKTVLNTNADIGFAFDGDGDRVIATTKDGIIKDGDDLLCLLVQHSEYNNEKHVVGTIMTNYGFELFLQKQEKTLIRTQVGDKYVAEQLDQHNARIGGETSGHIIIKDYLATGDGIFVALKTLESIITNNNWAMKTFSKTPQCLVNVPVQQKKNLTQEPLKSIIDEHESLLQNGRTVIRYSGTENLLRIMVEDQSEQKASSVALSLQKHLQSALQ